MKTEKKIKKVKTQPKADNRIAKIEKRLDIIEAVVGLDALTRAANRLESTRLRIASLSKKRK